MAVPLQTETTVQYLEQGGPVRLAEHSLDPRQLAAALLAAVRGTSVELREGAGEIELEKLRADYVVHANGAWFRNVVSRLGGVTPGGIVPVKGQMLRVRLPPELRDLQEVHRSEEVYIVPRTCGPQAGTALIGATVEAAGFDTTTHAADLAELRAKGATLMPALGEENAAPQLEAWAGLRPAAADRLPVIGGSGGQYVATGHFRDGILLAPATAVVLADLIEGRTPSIALAAFSPSRFAEQPAHPLR
jgi:glycine oxidase